MSLKGKNIFIIEDDMQNRVVYQMILVKQGAHVEFDRWGRETLHYIRRMSQVDLIILDLMLPGGHSGYEIYDILREEDRFADVPIIAVSAADVSMAVRKTQEKGFNGFIAKPIDVSTFPDQLISIINGEPIWDTAGRF